MKIRQAKKIMNYYKRFYGSKYWLWRWGYYCGMKSIGKNAGDHRITKAMILAERWNARRYRNEAAKFSEKNQLRPRDLRRSVERLKQYSV